jgi:DNA polymerase elongation subunit (family B)
MMLMGAAERPKEEAVGGGRPACIDFGSVMERLGGAPPKMDAAEAEAARTLMVLDIIVQRSPQNGQRTEALLLGRSEDGGSACVCVTGWQPYLLIRAPAGWSGTADRHSAVKELLGEKLDTYFERRAAAQPKQATQKPKPKQVAADAQGPPEFASSSWRRSRPTYIYRVSTVQAKSIYGYSSDGLGPFLKLEMVAPYLVSAMRDVLVGYPLKPQEEGDAAATAAAAAQKNHGGGGRMRGCVLHLHPFSLAPCLLEGQSETFNSNLDAVQQFMVDVGLFGCQWVRVASADDAEERRRGGARVGKEKEDAPHHHDDHEGVGRVPAPDDRRSRCRHEWHVDLHELELLDVEAVTRIAPLRVLSFDIEAAGRRGVFPQASDDPVIQIGMHFEVVGGGERLRPVMLSLHACDPIEGADVIAFDDEAALLRAFRDLVVAFDADVFTGYNILGFDFPYLHDRAAALCGEEPRPISTGWGRVSPAETDDTTDAPLVRHFDNMTRLRGVTLQLLETEYVSAQTGKRKRTRVTIAGRVSLDMLVAIQNSQHRLEQYKLDAVAKHFLGDQKVDIPFTQITPMWRAGPAERRELAIYCLKDAQLPLDLNAKIDALTQTVEMARSTGILFDAVLQRGIMVRNTSLLLRRARVRGLVFPNLSPFGRQLQAKEGPSPPTAIGRTQRYVGATVLDPVCGIHRYVGVLDFSAMYPSIIRAHNLCYSTIVLEPTTTTTNNNKNKRARTAQTTTTTAAEEEEEEEAEGLLRVCGHTFVPETRFKGLIPEVVEHLQNCRTKAKRAYAEATDPMAKQVCKARELAFKVAGNGVYGALGSTLSLLPLLAIAESVTAIGRIDILMVKRMAEAMFPEGQVVYGDTDSVFVRMPLAPEVAAITMDGVLAASAMAEALAAKVNARLKSPKKIEFEKVFDTMMLLSKKRYAGTKYEPGFKFGVSKPALDVKGLQSVRRDGSPLVRDLVRDVIQSILESGAATDAAALVRRTLLDVVEDKLPLETYAVKKTLRKGMADCCHPMRPAELSVIRAQLRGGGVSAAPLSYAEQDEAIHRHIALPWRPRVRLPHVLLAWRLRLADPGSAPVPGESIEYVLTNNGGARPVYVCANNVSAPN